MSFLGYVALLLCWMHCAAQRACEEPPPRRIKEVPTERWDKPPYPHGTQATYSCRPGYVKSGRVVFQCIDGAWKQQNPGTECRNKPCGHPGDTEFGFFELTNGTEFVFGARVEYRCNDGYQMLSQKNYRECQAGGWSNDIPHCEVIKCLPVQEPENGRIIMTGAFELGQEYSFGQVVNFECNANHKLVGAEEIVCSANGKWSNDVPQCKEIICDVPKILHGHVSSPKESYKENELMQFFCDEGYKYGNTGDALCTESGWNPPPYCTEIVCFPPVISSGDFRPRKDTYTEGDTITVDCDDGYHFEAMTGRTTAECTKNGWLPKPDCVEKCSVRGLENGSFQRKFYREGQKAKYTCNKDYRPEHEFVTCTWKGWVPRPRCTYKKKCQNLVFENGYLQSRREHNLNEWNLYVCHAGFVTQEGQGSGYTQCQESGWTPPPKCIKKCQHLVFENGYLQSRREHNLNEWNLYVCHAGFVTQEGQGSGYTQCQESGWTPPPKCIKACKAPGGILIHHTNKTVFMPEDTIEYSCLEGYKTTNNMPTDTTMCGKNGEWSPAPQCHEIKCVLPRLSNGHFSPYKSKYRSGAVVKFTCAKNYIRVGSASIQCYHFGWFPPPPVCQVDVKDCGPPREIINGNIVDGSAEQYQHGDKIKYECNDQFKLVGSKETECINGQWSSPPSCTEDKMPCESPSSIPNVVLHQADQAQYSHGDEVTCGCKPGSDNTEEMKIKCLNGEWKPLPVCADAYPRCVIPEDVVLVGSGQSLKKTEFHKVIHYKCRSTDKNVEQATCVSGRWTPEIACAAEESACPPPPQVSGVQQTTAGRNYRNGSKASFSCPDGFQLIGTKEITCTDGKWQSPPHCVERPCLPPQSVKCADASRLENPNLKIEREGKTIYLPGARFKYISRSGYTLDGPTEANCSMGKWTAAPSCLEMPCGSVPKVANAQIEGRKVNSYEPGETVQYRCDPGFLIVGSPEIMCREGNWTAKPFCKDVSCGAAPEVPNARIVSTPQEKYLSGDRVQYQCESNFQIIGEENVFCSNGQWSQAPVCRGQDGRCGKPPPIQYGEPISSPKLEYEEGDTVEYKCPHYYIFKASPIITCHNGLWTNPPVCLEPCTASPEDMARNNIELKWDDRPKLYSKSGDYIQFSCKRGYVEDPNTSSFRVQCVEGTLEYPRCIPGRNCALDKNTMNMRNIQLQSPRRSGGPYLSGDLVIFKCKSGYQEVSQPEEFEVQCWDGVITYPECEKLQRWPW